MSRFIAAFIAGALFSAPVLADWVLDNDASTLSFVSTKAGNVAEVHHFGSLSGKVDGDGDVVITIAMESLDTGIPIRNERMLEMLFEAAEFPTATLNATVELASVEGLSAGESTGFVSEAQLMIRDQSTNLTVDLLATRLDPDRLQVASRAPMIVNAGQLGLLGGVEALRDIAGLPSISPAVPVSFILIFQRGQ